MKNLLIIDGNSIVNRAFYGIKLLTNKFGLFTNGIYGFLKIMFKHIEDLNPDYICVAFDLKAPTFRHKMFKDYKAQRKGMPEELRVQIPVLKEVLQAMNITILEKEGFEADDIIGTVSRICDEQGLKCHILTGDRDDLQLASDNTDVLLTVTRMGNTTTTVFDAKKVLDEYGVTPTEFIDVKGLMGDTSDNIPGVKGIGEKTAFGYIQKFKSIEALYENLDDEIVKNAARQKLIDGKEMAFLSKTLCTIDRNVDLGVTIDDFKRQEYNVPRLTELFVNLEFNAFLKSLSTQENDNKCINGEFEFVTSASELTKLLGNATGEFVYKIFDSDKKIDALTFLVGDKVFFARGETIDTEVLRVLKEIFENENILKISNDAKSDMILLENYNICLDKSYFDTGIAAYIISPSKSSYDTASIALDFLSETIPNQKDTFGTGKDKKDIFSIDDSSLEAYVKGETVMTKALKEYEEEKIKTDGQQHLLYDIELPLARVLADMETEGFKIDRDSLRIFTDDLTAKISLFESEIYALAGEEFNINSTKQLGVVLFEKLGLKVVKKTKTGYSTDAAVLEKLMGAHPIIEKIIEYRRAAKLKSTYGDGLLAVINENTGKIHSSFNQTVTTTGRISSTEPNLQNIPMRRDEGREIRKMFVPSDGNILIDADYSQIELRILAHMSGDEAMADAFRSGEDIHASTASRVFGVDKSEVTPLLRSRAKAVNFGIVYGMGDFSLSQDLHISVKEAKAYIESYFEKYSKVKNYLDTTVADAKKNGYVTTLFGRRRYIPEILSSNFIQRSFGERVAMNTPIQGTAADIIKIAMVSVHRELKNNGMKAKLILQVHDELIIEAPVSEADSAAAILEKCMTEAAALSVPLAAESGMGKSWFEAH